MNPRTSMQKPKSFHDTGIFSDKTSHKNTVIHQPEGCNEANNLNLVRIFNVDSVIGDVFRPLKEGCVIDLTTRIM